MLRCVQSILDRNKELNSDERQAGRGLGRRKRHNNKFNSLLSDEHLKRINRIHQRFRRNNEHQLAPQHVDNYMDNQVSKQQNSAYANHFLYPMYEQPAKHTYPKNPFSNDRNNQSSQLAKQTLQTGAFHVGMKFVGNPMEMLKLICYCLVKIEIEWQYDAKEMKLKCRTKVDDEKLIDDDKFIEDFIRQQFLKFYVYINKHVKSGTTQQGQQKKSRGPPAAQSQDNSDKNLAGKSKAASEAYIVNLYLQKGTIPVFLEMANQFFSIIQSQLANQDKMKGDGKYEQYPSNQLDHNMTSVHTAAHTNITPSINDNEMTDMERVKKAGQSAGTGYAPLAINQKFDLAIIN